MINLILTLIAVTAFADCKNLIETSDAEKMLRGEPHGKQYLKCDSGDCICIDDIVFEHSEMKIVNGKKAIVVDPIKKAIADSEKIFAKQQRQEILQKLHDETISNAEMLGLLKTIFPLAEEK